MPEAVAPENIMQDCDGPKTHWCCTAGSTYRYEGREIPRTKSFVPRLVYLLVTWGCFLMVHFLATVAFGVVGFTLQPPSQQASYRLVALVLVITYGINVLAYALKVRWDWVVTRRDLPRRHTQLHITVDDAVGLSR